MTGNPWSNASTPQWEQLAESLRTRIERGEWDDVLLPTEMHFEEEYNVGRATVRRALLALEHQGLLSSSRGRGRQVRRYHRLNWWPARFEHRDHRRDDGQSLDAWRADVAAQGRAPEQQIEVSLVPASSIVAENLGIDSNETVACRARTRYVDDLPWQTADSYYPMWMAQLHNSLLLTPGDVTVPGGFMAHLGHAQVRFTDQLTARMPSQAEMSRLGIAAGTPIVEHVRTGYDADDISVRCIITIAPGDRHVIRYEVAAQ